MGIEIMGNNNPSMICMRWEAIADSLERDADHEMMVKYPAEAANLRRKAEGLRLDSYNLRKTWGLPSKENETPYASAAGMER